MNSNFNFQPAKSLTPKGDRAQPFSFREGDPESIANSLNNYLAPQGIRAKVAWKNAYLGILLEALHVPDRKEMTEIIRQRLSNVLSESVKAIKLYGREAGQITPAWSEDIAIAISLPSDNHSLSVASWLSQGSHNKTTSTVTSSIQQQSDLAKFLRFYFSPEDTALLPLKNVKEVLNIPLMGILPVPHMADCLIGIYNYRGEILWLVDLGAQLGFVSSTEFIQNVTSSAELSLKNSSNLSANKGIALTNDLPTLTIIIIQNDDKHLGIVVPKVVDIEMHDIHEMQYPSEELFLPNILPFLKGYLIRSSSPVLDINALIEDSQLNLHFSNEIF